MWQLYHNSAFPSVQSCFPNSFALAIPRVCRSKPPAHKSSQGLLFRQPNVRHRVDAFLTLCSQLEPCYQNAVRESAPLLVNMEKLEKK